MDTTIQMPSICILLYNNRVGEEKRINLYGKRFLNFMHSTTHGQVLDVRGDARGDNPSTRT